MVDRVRAWENLPNIISVGRFLSVPVIVPLILFGYWELAFWLFFAAGVSDAVDGFIAKRFDAVTVLGGYLDPIADKALLVGTYVALAQQGALPVWLVFLVVFRDLSIVGGAVLLQTLPNSHEIRPLLVSKVNTVAQIVLAAWVLGERAFAIAFPALAAWLIYAVAATTLLSGLAYLQRATRRAGDLERQQ